MPQPKIPDPKNDSRYGLGEPLADPKDAKVDIVFVHGLGGDRIGTWTGVGKDADGKEFKELWPKTLLPEACPTARILSFGYNAYFAHFYHLFGPEEIAEELTIDDHSKALFTSLIGLRDNTKTSDRPVIFVCHSLGGLVVANALSQNYRDLDEKSTNLSSMTIGTLFLGTPFAGSAAAKYGHLAEGLYSLVSSTQSDNLKNLQKRSEKLATINDEFAKLLRSRDRSESRNFIEVATFFEEYPVRKLGKKTMTIVPKESASIFGFDLQSIAANHMDMTKFEGSYVPGYIDVSNKLKQWIKGLDMSKEQRKNAGLGNAGKINNVSMSHFKVDGGNVIGVAEPGANPTGTAYHGSVGTINYGTSAPSTGDNSGY
ncbi:hypothetical protein HYFRA_00011875 [Hymenoscyphus fraxineus]|uniref:DUF676 domain-containing protein n=1 Tax=Hymenoscyphus fraxineus TaxID=746836 RepID=A0A9N9PQS1_9HELO|nr:hypothetical protein HYFRA_00011875 [Hymenoscyphus fraxineus]